MSGGRTRRHEVHDQKVCQTADPVDQQPFPQAQRQTGDWTTKYLYDIDTLAAHIIIIFIVVTRRYIKV